MMARRVADVFKVVVFTAGAHAALRAGGTLVGALFIPQKHMFKLHHARVGKQQRGVVTGDQRTAGYGGVALVFKIMQKGGAYFGALDTYCVGSLSRARVWRLTLALIVLLPLVQGSLTRLTHQHTGDTIAYWVGEAPGPGDQLLMFRTVLQRPLGARADEDAEQVLVKQ